MISISNLKNAHDAADYYEKEDYYVKGEENEKWWGKGAVRLNLEGEVDKEIFLKVLKGKRKKHAPGIDVTFSPPKSVSIMAEVYGDKRIYKAHTKSVERVLRHIQENHIHVRKYVEGKQTLQKADNLTVAMFMHHTSRNLDPQLHTHCVLANVVYSEDKKWRAAYFGEIFDEKLRLGQIYRFELAYELACLGYDLEISNNKSMFEIKDVPQSLIELFSSRSEDIKAAAAEYKHVSAKLKAELALKTRKTKKEVDP